MIQDIAKSMAEKETTREAADTLITVLVSVLDMARAEGMSDKELAEVLRDTVSDLKSIRQNIARFREIRVLDIEE